MKRTRFMHILHRTRGIYMKIKIAVFGRDDMLLAMPPFLRDQEQYEIMPYPYEEAKEAVDLIEQAFMCDVYLFLEPLAYLYVKEKMEKKKWPVVQVAQDEYMILSSFYRMKTKLKQPIHRISIDMLEQCPIDNVIQELQLQDRDIFIHPYGNMTAIDPKVIANLHIQLWQNKRIDSVLTSVEEVAAILVEMGIPVATMHMPDINVAHAVNKAITITQINQSKSAQIVASYVKLKHPENLKHKKDETLAQLHQLLLRFAKKTYASVLPSMDDQFVLFGTRGVLDHITNHYRDFPLLLEIEGVLKTEVDIGFGLGLTAKQAEDHAVLALEACARTASGSCFIVNDRQEVIGPLGVKKHFDKSRLYQALIHKARLNNELSYNFIDFISNRNNEPFSSHDIATYYQVTKRSAERTINKLLTGEVIKVVGQEKPYLKGRPRKLFQINV